MLKDYFKEQILSNFGHLPTDDQQKAVEELTDFIFSTEATEVFVLRGFAGTGKTSLIGALVKTMGQLERECVLMAPTGRAAKVFSLYADHPAFTIHKRIYRQKSMDQDGVFSLNYNPQKNVLFIVDEASMIGTHSQPLPVREGSGYSVNREYTLLEDLITFVYGGGTCRLILLGDTAQLPPVGETDSPALQPDVLRSCGLLPRMVTMKQIVRQQESSGILWNATRLRQLLENEEVFDWPQIRFAGFADVKNVAGNELIETLANCYARYGKDETMVVCRSNKRAILYNKGIRHQILDREEELSSQELVMIAKNNYFWLKAPSNSPEWGRTPAPENPEQMIRAKYQTADPTSPEKVKERIIEEMAKHPIGVLPHSGELEGADFLANGDIAVIQRVRHERELYGFRFADCVLRLPDYDDYEFEATVLLDTLHEEAPALTYERQEQLFQRVLEDYADIPLKRDRMKALKEDPHFNALQIKYAYAVTCHKAQGGQWSHLFIDQGYMTEEMLGPDYYRWLYTALTRATNTVYFVNWRDEQTLPEGA